MHKVVWIALLLVSSPLLFSPAGGQVPALPVPVPGPGAVLAPFCNDLDGIAPCNLKASHDESNNELSIAMNPTDEANMVITSKDYSLGRSTDCRPSGKWRVWAGYYVTKDAGKTWTQGLIPGYPGDPSGFRLPYLCSSDPVVLFDVHGTAWFVGLNFQYVGGRQAGLYIAKSTDGGLTWPISDIHVLHKAPSDDKQWFAIDPKSGNIYVTQTSGGITVQRSNIANHKVWTAPIVLGSGQGSFPVVDSDGTVHVVWNSGSISYRRSFDGGQTWTATRAISSVTGTPSQGKGGFRTPQMPHMAVDMSGGARDGALYVVWHDGKFGSPDAVGVRSLDGGATWSDRFRINDDPGRVEQWFPTVTVDEKGVVHYAWIDRRDNPNTYDLYMAQSKDGVTLTPNLRVSQVSSDPKPCEHQDGSVFIGDYIGVVADGEHAFPAWSDTRSGVCDAYTAPVGEIFNLASLIPVPVSQAGDGAWSHLGTPGEDVPPEPLPAILN